MKVQTLLSAILGAALWCRADANVSQCCDVQTSRDVFCQSNPDDYQKYVMVGRILQVDEVTKTMVVKVLNAYKGTTGEGTRMTIKYSKTGPTVHQCDRIISQANVRKAYMMSGATQVSTDESYTEGCDLFRLWDEVDKLEREEWTQFRSNEAVACGKKCTNHCLKYADTCKECDCSADGELINCVGECYNTANSIQPECVCHSRLPPSTCELECEKWAKDSSGCTLCKCDDTNIATVVPAGSTCDTHICDKGFVCTLDENDKPSCDEDDGIVNLSPVGSTCDTVTCDPGVECEMVDGTPNCGTGNPVQKAETPAVNSAVKTCGEMECNEHAGDPEYKSACIENDGVPECIYSKFAAPVAVPGSTCDTMTCDEHTGDPQFRTTCIEHDGAPECVYSKFAGHEASATCDTLECNEHAGDSSFKSTCIERDGKPECVYSKFATTGATQDTWCATMVCDKHAGDSSYKSACVETNGVPKCVYSKFGDAESGDKPPVNAAEEQPSVVCENVVCDEHKDDPTYKVACIEKLGSAECVYSKFQGHAAAATCATLACDEHAGDASFRSTCVEHDGKPECVYSKFGAAAEPIAIDMCDTLVCDEHKDDPTYRSACVKTDGVAKCVYSKFDTSEADKAETPPMDEVCAHTLCEEGATCVADESGNTKCVLNASSTCETTECNEHPNDPLYHSECVMKEGTPECVYTLVDAAKAPPPELQQYDMSMPQLAPPGDSCAECPFGSSCVGNECVKVCVSRAEKCPDGQVCAVDMNTGGTMCSTDLCKQQDLCNAHDGDPSYRSGCILKEGVPKCIYSQFTN